MVETGGAEVSADGVGERRVVAEDDAFEDRAAFSRQAGRDRGGEPAAKPVGQAAETAAAADGPPGVDPGDDVHAVATKPGPLVEAVFRPARKLELAEHLEHCPLRRRAPTRQLEQHRLFDAQETEPCNARRDADLEAAPRCRAGDRYARPLGGVDVRRQRTAVERVERVEPEAAPPPAGAGREQRDPGEARPGRADPEGSHDAERNEEQKRMQARQVRRSEADAERRRTEMRRGEPHGHGTTRPRRFSIRAGPIPGIASSSSTDLNGPCACR